MNTATTVRVLIWTYFILLIWEGAFRKWILPGFSDFLLIARDPVALAIYALALRRFPWGSRLVVLTVLLAALGFLGSLASEGFDLVVTVYGLRVNYLHIPLIFVIPYFMHRGHVIQMGRWMMLFSIPVVYLMSRQFDSTLDSAWNVGVGGTTAGQLKAAVGDKARSSGPFAFITGPVLFFPIVVAFVLNALTYRRQAALLLAVVAGAACLLAVPVSISRSLLLATVITAACYGMALVLRPRLAFRGARVTVVLALALGIVSSTTLFERSSAFLNSRWHTATVEGGGFMSTIVGRMMADFRMPLEYVPDIPFFGHGVGVGTNVGARMLTGTNSFLLAEGEWGRILLESGPLLGLATILLRVAITLLLLHRSLRRLRQGDVLPLMLWSACAFNLLAGQWGPPTSLGFAVLGGGLILAACRPAPEADELESRLARSVAEDESYPTSSPTAAPPATLV